MIKSASLRLAPHGVNLCVLAGFCWAWVFYYAPYYPLDFSMGIPLMYEMRHAWTKYGVFDFDFSPFRCLGLPTFSNPSAMLWSLYHFFVVLFEEHWSIFSAMLVMASMSYFGCVELCSLLKINRYWGSVLALGWCLQGFISGHNLAGHGNFYQFGLTPFFLWVMLQKNPRWYWMMAAAFWYAHLTYTSGIYLLIMSIPGLLASVFLIRYFLVDQRDQLSSFKRSFFILMGIGVLSFLMSAPRLIGVMNFSYYFPRNASMLDVSVWKSFLYSLSHFFFPFPYDIQAYMGWWYGDWEAYAFLFPGLFFYLVWRLWANRKNLPVKGIILSFAVLICIGTVMTAGLQGPLFKMLPILKSLHVNPRWTAIIMLPMFILCLIVIQKDQKVFHWILYPILWCCFIAAPISIFDWQKMNVRYSEFGGINKALGKADFCYEPLFGYELEQFPLGPRVNWTQEKPVDPRCYLKQYECQPGTPLIRPGISEKEVEDFATYRLKDELGLVRSIKYPSLFFYLFGFCLAMFEPISHVARKVRLVFSEPQS